MKLWEILSGVGYCFAFLFSAVLSVFGTGLLAAMIRDASSSQPLLVLSREGLQDRRQLPSIVPWNNVESIRVSSDSNATLAYLTFRQPVYVSRNRFRFGGSFKEGFKSNIRVLLSTLDQDELKIGKVMVALVTENGGKLRGSALPYSP
ncbi:hypothetical protein [Mesorhizobium sp. NZP2077]|uniref:hypothetical protein n=1 Tax=Mesorhizobium sp. NZP2077 TaxID=2483404 RepID=UPI001552512D|nr:hypothetical protein [Mesorhizobium sp. NZP2077]QKC84771.1 hypothetical protein EB232_27125 [Mesorhizobium sp. NZP2077]QKD18364.1 hypothetical protein HGP13_26830 [Mesorhizobium sp. NZP2077]